MKVTITVTNDKGLLFRIWDQAYADAHAGKTYQAEIGDEGLAVVEYETGKWAKFPAWAYLIALSDDVRFRTHCVREGLFDGKGYGERLSLRIMVEFAEKKIMSLRPMVKAMKDPSWEVGPEDNEICQEKESLEVAVAEAKKLLG